jgi:tryptophan-rich sensory protein
MSDPSLFSASTYLPTSGVLGNTSYQVIEFFILFGYYVFGILAGGGFLQWAIGPYYYGADKKPEGGWDASDSMPERGQYAFWYRWLRVMWAPAPWLYMVIWTVIMACEVLAFFFVYWYGDVTNMFWLTVISFHIIMPWLFWIGGIVLGRGRTLAGTVFMAALVWVCQGVLLAMTWVYYSQSVYPAAFNAGGAGSAINGYVLTSAILVSAPEIWFTTALIHSIMVCIWNADRDESDPAPDETTVEVTMATNAQTSMAELHGTILETHTGGKRKKGKKREMEDGY